MKRKTTVTFEVQDISHILLKSTMFCKCNSTDNVIICVIFDNQNYLQNFLKRIGKVKIICDVNWYAHISLILSFDFKEGCLTIMLKWFYLGNVLHNQNLHRHSRRIQTFLSIDTQLWISLVNPTLNPLLTNSKRCHSSIYHPCCTTNLAYFQLVTFWYPLDIKVRFQFCKIWSISNRGCEHHLPI